MDRSIRSAPSARTTDSSARTLPIVLPLFLDRTNKYPVGIAMFAFTILIYLTSNHFHLTPPQLLPMTALDLATPYIPMSFWMYISEIPFFIAMYITMSPNARMNKFIYAFTTLQILSIAIFLYWPTTYPRMQFPTPDRSQLDAGTYWLMTILRIADTPANCFPSLHVSSTFLCAFAFLEDQRRYFPFFFSWAFLITLSTMTTKQHYAVDAIGGVAMAYAVYWFFHRVVNYRQAKR